jgi:hypothetical protein
VDALASIAVNVGDLPSAILDHLPVGVCACDVKGYITSYNACALQLWGCRPGPQTRYSGAKAAYDAERRALREGTGPIAVVLRSAKPQRNFELTLEREDGSRVSILSSVVPLFDDSGALAGAIDVFQDISERNRLEQARRIAERTHSSVRFANDLARRLQQPVLSLSSMLEALRAESQLTAVTRERIEDVARQFSMFQMFAKHFNSQPESTRLEPTRI